jgi:predicted RNA methylase
MSMESDKPTPPEVYERVLVPAVLQALSTRVVDLAAPREGERVLDLACGTGIVARTVAPIVGATGSVVGVDVLPPMLAVARSLPLRTGRRSNGVKGMRRPSIFPTPRSIS